MCVGPAIGADEAPPADSRPAAARPAADNRVVVLTFSAEGGDTAASYGRSLQQSLSTDLTGTGVVQGITRKQVGEDTDSAIAAARESGARYVVFGQVVQVDQQVRVTGQIFDTQAGKAIAILRTTGTAGDLLRMQDALGQQAVNAFTGNSARDAAVPTALQSTKPMAPATSNPYNAVTSWKPESASGTLTVVNVSTPADSQGQQYSDLYETPAQAAPAPAATYYPPQAPPPPMGGYDNNYYNPYAYGGGSFSGTPIFIDGNFTVAPAPLGTVRVQTFNTLGHSIINPPTTGSQTGSAPASSFYTPPGSPTPIPAHAAPITAYKNPWAPFAAPVGVPQRAAPPVLRPQAMSSSAVRAAPAAARSGGGGAAVRSSGGGSTGARGR